MKLKIETRGIYPGSQPVYATACVFPRTRYITKDRGHPGSRASTGTSQWQHEQDLKQIAGYLASHEGCKVADIAMECQMSRHAVRRLLRECRRFGPES